MKKKTFTRLEIQEILERNELGADVSYIERESDGTPDNYIIYMRLAPSNSIRADNGIYIRKALIQVTHFHKKKLDSIEDLILKEFGVEAIAFNIEQPSKRLATYYRFEIFTNGGW